MINIRGNEYVLDTSGAVIAAKRQETKFDGKYDFFNYDIRGSVTGIIGSDGKRIVGYTYDEFGKEKVVGDTNYKNDIMFSGSLFDRSTGLYYMNSRFYNSSAGRFISQDSYKGNVFEPWTQHLYVYTANNPVNFVDPTGHERKLAIMDNEGYESNKQSTINSRSGSQKNPKNNKNIQSNSSNGNNRVSDKEVDTLLIALEANRDMYNNSKEHADALIKEHPYLTNFYMSVLSAEVTGGITGFKYAAQVATSAGIGINVADSEGKLKSAFFDGAVKMQAIDAEDTIYAGIATKAIIKCYVNGVANSFNYSVNNNVEFYKKWMWPYDKLRYENETWIPY